MNRIFLFCVAALAPFVGTAQITFSLDSLEMAPTTIDSTATAEITVSNALTLEQSVTFSGVEGPYSMAPNPLLVPAEGSATATLTFNPVSVDTFVLDLVAAGNAFGTDTLHVEGEGTLPGAVLLLDTLDFGTVSVNSNSTAYLPIASNGIGSLFIDEITSDNPVVSATGGVIIASGDTAQVPIQFYSEFSGVYEVAITITTSDPFNPVFEAVCLISAISEVGGEVCGTWSAINSPYQLIDNIVVPDSCTLTIEPGVIVLGDSLDIEVFGAFYANGTEAAPVNITVGELLSHTSAENMVLTHTEVTETNEFEFFDTDYRDFRDVNIYASDSLPQWLDFIDGYGLIFENENPLLGKYYEDFADNDCQGWELTYDSWPCPSSFSQTCNGESYNRVYDNCSSNYSGWIRTYSPTFQMNAGELPTSVSFFMDTYNNWQGYNASYIDYNIAYRIDGAEWIDLENSSSYLNNATKTFDLSSLLSVETIQFRMSGYFRYRGTLRIDNFQLLTNFYPGVDAPLPAAAAAASLSTGGIQLFASTYNGDFHSIGDSIDVVLDNSAILGNEARDKDSHGLGLYADHVNLSTLNSNASGHGLDGIHIESLTTDWTATTTHVNNNGQDGVHVNGDLDWSATTTHVNNNGQDGVHVNGDLDWSATTTHVNNNGQDGVHVNGDLDWSATTTHVNNNGQDGVHVNGDLDWSATTTHVNNNGQDGVECFESSANVTIDQCTIEGNGADGIRLSGETPALQGDYSFITENGGDAIDMGYGGELRMDNSLIAYNGGMGVRTEGAVELNYMNVLHNGSTGIHTNQFSTVNNSIVWFNGGVPQMTTYNTYASSYTNVQGINALLTSTEFAWGDGCIGTDPVLADSLGHLDPFSPCVDGGMPWEQDAHIPYGLGSSRADMGMYGGPANAYWGGQAPPDGAVVITDLFDIPQDQGGTLGLHFSASPFDFGGLGFNVTHYSIWRDLALGSDVPTIVGEGNWEQIGEVPAQGFSQYGYTASTLVDAVPGDSTCLSSFIVIAHTTDDNIYWVSDVVAACSYDNLAPVGPDLDGDVLMDDPENPVVVLSWPVPEEEDYAYTVIERAGGASSNVVGDTLLLDADVVPGVSYDYFGYHLDLNGNASDTAYVTVMVDGGRDVIALAAGWNLISLDRTPDDAALEVVMGSLEANNLQYAIGFDQGVTLYDPTGLPFLNTLTSVQDGFGYWVKVTESDTLRVQGQSIEAGYLPALDAGWNLVAYTAENDASPGSYLADLLANDNLEYVTGFDGGVEVYDPNGLPFLNSLTALRNGFGYWVKTETETAGLAEVESGGKSPAFDVINGRSDLAAGSAIEVLSNGEACATIEVLPGGWLMTTALHGDDPATSALEGLTPGTVLQFRHVGRLANESITWQGDMRLTKLDLHFGGLALALFPNPVTEGATVTLDLPQAGMLTLAVFGAQGQRVKEQVLAASNGVNTIAWSMGDLAPGVYQLQARMHGKTAGSIEFLVK